MMAMKTERQDSALEDLLDDCVSRSALVLQLKEQPYWRTLIFQEQPPLDDSTMHTLLLVFNKCFSCRLHTHIQHEIMKEILDSSFIDVHLVSFVKRWFRVATRQRQMFTDFLNTFANFFEVSRKFIFALADLRPIIVLLTRKIKSAVKRRLKIDYSETRKFDRILEKYKQFTWTTSDGSLEYNFQNDYQYMEILPKAGELTNLIRDKYIYNENFRDFKHYLSMQFLVLRHDMIWPLKSAIRRYLRESDGNGDNISIFHNVKIKAPIQTENGAVVYELNFDVRPFENTERQNSRKLIYGSLLCLSGDKFETVTYAVVHSRNQVNQGTLNVRFINQEGEETDYNRLERLNTTYLMVESPAFYEMYISLLRGLQDQFLPNHYYLFNPEPYINAPSYLKQHETINLSFLCNKLEKNCDQCNVLSNINVKKFVAKKFTGWSDTMLNSKQQEALHKALTSSVSLIHTPPGTGKLYIGLTIVHALLLNLGETCKKQILVVFPDDKILDNFLDKLVPMDGVVRIGGSSDSAMHRYSINKAVEIEMNNSMYAQSLNDVDQDLRNMRQKLFQLEFFQYCKTSYVLHESELDDLPNPDRQLIKTITSTFSHDDSYRNSALFSWLGLSFEDGIHTRLPKAVNLTKENLNSDNRLESTESYQSKEAFEEPMRKSKSKFTDEETRNITEVGVKTSHRKLEISYNQGCLVSKRDFNDEKHLKVECMSDPLYMYRISEYDDIKSKDIPDLTLRKRVEYIKKRIFEFRANCRKKQELCIQELYKTDIFPIDAVNLPIVTNMTLIDRWKLYRRWIKLKETLLKEKLKVSKKKYAKAIRRRHELLSQIEHDVLRNARLIAITATAAAKFQPILHELCCQFIIVEDAEQFLESQIAVLLTKKTHSLTLIGDHKRLRPQVTTSFMLEKTKLNISLFERIIKNAIPTTTLNVQYRMRTEISELCKLIYPEIVEDTSVSDLPNILGMKYNIFFVTHNHWPKLVLKPNSFINIFEAKYIVALCKYLLEQGYKAQQITVLTPYFSQALEIQKRFPETCSYKKIHITTIDNYRGQHNDIVLLSLTRTRSIEACLKDENCIATALSRATLGIYALGDFDLLDSTSPCWHNILSSLKDKHCIGSALPLVCQQHSHYQAMIKTAKDFSSLTPNGGCLKDCETYLGCGHKCKKMCHSGEHGLCDC